MYTPVAVCVDDDPTTASIVRETLSKLGYRVEMATNRAEAVRLAEELKPALAYVSDELHDVEAMELYHAIQAVSQHTQGILCSDLETGMVAFLTGKQGIHQVLLKPAA